MEAAKGREASWQVPHYTWSFSHVDTPTSFAAEKKVKKDSGHQPSKDGEELDQVAGNAEDEIGERIAGIRESELLYGPESLLAVFGPMLVHICGSPQKFKVSASPHNKDPPNRRMTESDFACCSHAFL